MLGGTTLFIKRCVSVAQQWLGTGLVRLIALCAGQVADRVVQKVGCDCGVCGCIAEEFLHIDSLTKKDN